MDKKIPRLITLLGFVLMFFNGIVWVYRGATFSDFDVLILSVNVGLLGLIGQLGSMIEELKESINYTEKR